MHVWPFEGRAAELAAIRKAYAGSARAAVLIRSPAGLGKTRLAREALTRLGCRTEWITATRRTSKIPFGALAHLIPAGVPRGAAGPLELLLAIRDQVAGWGGRRRVALGIDDAQLLDDASSTLVANVVTNGSAFTVLTGRSGEPLADCLARLSEEGMAEVIELGGLPDPVMDQLIDHSAVAVDPVRRRRLRGQARGNPLALRELLHGAVPGGLSDLAASKLDTLAPGARTVVEMVACAEPAPVPLVFLERLAGPANVVAAEDSGLVVCEQAGARAQARLDHPLFGEVLRARMPPARARQMYRDLAGELLATPMRVEDAPPVIEASPKSL